MELRLLPRKADVLLPDAQKGDRLAQPFFDRVQIDFLGGFAHLRAHLLHTFKISEDRAGGRAQFRGDFAGGERFEPAGADDLKRGGNDFFPVNLGLGGMGKTSDPFHIICINRNATFVICII